MINISTYIARFTALFPGTPPSIWHLPGQAEQVVAERIKSLSAEYIQSGTAFIHRTATVEQHVIMKGPLIIGPGCFVGAHAYLRGGVFLDEKAVVGPGCEVKSTFLFRGSALAHFNFAGDSIIGEGVNMEAGSILANHYNERNDKTIFALMDGAVVQLPVTKFGSLLGDGSKIGANAVLSPGTILPPRSIVKRLALIEQVTV
jgi:NDP-sugar pyrophosphorylase family protein